MSKEKLQKAKEWLAGRAQARGEHRYVPGAPTVLLPTVQKYVERVQQRRRA